jgi:hypothetical protein
MATPSGLNISTQAGEGGAAVLHWDQFNSTVNDIYQRDLANLTSIRAESGKLNLELGDAAKHIRPADMPGFQANLRQVPAGRPLCWKATK